MNNEIKEIKILFPGQILDYVDTKEHLLELFNYITNLQEENKRLNNDFEQLKENYEIKRISQQDLLEQNKRLNNIIDELEKYLEHQWLEWKDDFSDEIVAMANEDKAVLDKLKALKEGKE